MKLHERLKENRELGRVEGLAQGVLKEKIRMIRKLYLNGHDAAYITDFVDENEDVVKQVIDMIESNQEMDDITIAEVILSQI